VRSLAAGVAIASLGVAALIGQAAAARSGSGVHCEFSLDKTVTTVMGRGLTQSDCDALRLGHFFGTQIRAAKIHRHSCVFRLTHSYITVHVTADSLAYLRPVCAGLRATLASRATEISIQ
jgi:hypothetical protein